jgi:hypothetical protein
LNLEKTYITLCAVRDEHIDQSKLLKQRIDKLKRKQYLLERASWVITKAAELTQASLQTEVETLVTDALQFVYDKDFEFKLIFERKQNRLHIRPVIMEEGEEYDPEEERGGGVLDLVSFLFRIVLWSLQEEPSRPLFLMDEPMKNAGKGEMLDRIGYMFKKISHDLGIQLVIWTHEPQIAAIADRSFHVTYDGVKSTIRRDEDETT